MLRISASGLIYSEGMSRSPLNQALTVEGLTLIFAATSTWRIPQSNNACLSDLMRNSRDFGRLMSTINFAERNLSCSDYAGVQGYGMREAHEIAVWDERDGCWKWRLTSSGLCDAMEHLRGRQSVVTDRIRYLRSWHPGYAARTRPELERLIRELHENRRLHTEAVKALKGFSQ